MKMPEKQCPPQCLHVKNEPLGSESNPFPDREAAEKRVAHLKPHAAYESKQVDADARHVEVAQIPQVYYIGPSISGTARSWSLMSKTAWRCNISKCECDGGCKTCTAPLLQALDRIDEKLTRMSQ